MPLNVLGGNKVYTVPEIDALLKKTSGFAIVDKLPSPISKASKSVVYYKKGKGNIIDGYKRPGDPDDTEDVTDEPDDEHTEPIYRPVLIPYLVGEDTAGALVWYTTDSMTVSDVLTDEEILAIWNSFEPKFTSLRTTRHMAIKEA